MLQVLREPDDLPVSKGLLPSRLVTSTSRHPDLTRGIACRAPIKDSCVCTHCTDIVRGEKVGAYGHALKLRISPPLTGVMSHACELAPEQEVQQRSSLSGRVIPLQVLPLHLIRGIGMKRQAWRHLIDEIAVKTGKTSDQSPDASAPRHRQIRRDRTECNMHTDSVCHPDTQQ